MMEGVRGEELCTNVPIAVSLNNSRWAVTTLSATVCIVAQTSTWPTSSSALRERSNRLTSTTEGRDSVCVCVHVCVCVCVHVCVHVRMCVCVCVRVIN